MTPSPGEALIDHGAAAVAAQQMLSGHRNVCGGWNSPCLQCKVARAYLALAAERVEGDAEWRYCKCGADNEMVYRADEKRLPYVICLQCKTRAPSANSLRQAREIWNEERDAERTDD